MKYLLDLEKIVTINSYTQNKAGVDEVSQIMSGWLEELGFKTITYNRELIGDHHLHVSPKKENLPNILLLGHNDTVFPNGYFEGFSEDDEYIYGPGVCDMKGGNIVALEALRNIYKQNQKITNIDYLLVSDEETGSDDSSLLTSSLAKNYDYCFVFEAAGEKLELVTARKGVGRYIIRVEGKASHAGTSYQKGINANLEAAYKLQEYSKLMDFDKGTIVNVGKIEGGIGINTVSPHCEMMMEFRFNTEDEKKRIIKEVERITDFSYVAGTKSTANCVIQRNVMQENKKQFELIRLFERLINERIYTQRRGGVSDANIMAHMGVTTLDGFGPFGDGDHTNNERALKSSFIQRIKMMTTILSYFQKTNI
ncbi:M20 family metallopeptidase [Sulfurospirillum arcachonense]|uniref:M20 family metallopeptidase n=1 Tax=Sulfurospirillum arcachonense TaxID=57666 RepID=UPI000468D504|nr:M20 family metallopeptidase [Sulfurospirillum arcachonense]